VHRRIPLFRELFDCSDVLFRRIDRRCLGGAARDGLEREDAGAGEEVEKTGAVDPRADDVEERLSRAFGGGADVVRRDGDAAAAKCAGRDPEGVYWAALLPMK